MNSSPCEYESDTLSYFSAQLSGSELKRAEAHIAECAKCCQTLAELTRTMTAQASEKEQSFLTQNFENSAEKAKQLAKETIDKSAKNSTPSHQNTNVVLLSEHKINQNSKGFFLINWKAHHLAIAASLAIVFIIGAIAIFQLNNSPDSNSIADSKAIIEEIYRTGRTTDLRLSDFDYAAENKTRGSESEELKNKLLARRLTLEDIVEKDPSPQNRQLLAKLLVITGDYSLAIEQLSKAIETDNSNPSTLNDLAAAYSAEEDNEKALEFLNKALAIDENYLPAIFNRALIYKKLEKNEETRLELEKYLRLDSKSLWAVEAQQNLDSLNSDK